MRVVSSTDREDLQPKASEAFRQRWPEFVFHGEAEPRYLSRVREYFGEFDVLLLDGEDVAAGGWGVVFDWDGEVADLPDGYDGALARSVADHEAGRQPTTLSFMAAAVIPDGLNTLAVDRQADQATYVEENLWVRHG